MLDLNKAKWSKNEEILKDKIVILPIGALEAHGSHLPFGTDNYIAEELAERLAEKIDAVLLPLIPFGQVWSLSDFTGSISISDKSIISIIFDIASSLKKNNIKLFIIVNGHFGNRTALKKAERKIQEELSLNTLYFSHPGLSDLEKNYLETERPHTNYLHAEEFETSLMLNIDEKLVDMKKAVKNYPKFPSYFSSHSVPWQEIAEGAVLGNPLPADAEKGEKIAEGLVENMKNIIDDFLKEVD